MEPKKIESEREPLDFLRERRVYGHIRRRLCMQNNQRNQSPDNTIAQMSLPELRQKWAEHWGMAPHARIGRIMLEKSLAFKLRETSGEGLSAEQQKRLDNLVAQYKRNPRIFDERSSTLKPGIRLVKNYNGQHHSVLVCAEGFEYRDKNYGSLSEIATVITGTRWNGWVFFGLKKRGGS